MIDLAIFRISGIEFGVAFVVKTHKTFELLKAHGDLYGLTIETIGDSDDGDILCAVTGRDEEHTVKDANYFFKTLMRNKNDWVQDRDTIEGQRVLIFYAKETLS